jgi:hypothetical protein
MFMSSIARLSTFRIVGASSVRIIFELAHAERMSAAAAATKLLLVYLIDVSC